MSAHITGTRFNKYQDIVNHVDVVQQHQFNLKAGAQEKCLNYVCVVTLLLKLFIKSLILKQLKNKFKCTMQATEITNHKMNVCTQYKFIKSTVFTD